MSAAVIATFTVTILRGDDEWEECQARDSSPFVPESIELSYCDDLGVLPGRRTVTATGWVPRNGAPTLFSLPTDHGQNSRQVWESWTEGFYQQSDTYWAMRGDHAIKDLPTWISQILDEAVPDLWHEARRKPVSA